MRHSYHTEQWLPYPVEQVFTFFSNPYNLPLLMRDWQQARIDNLAIVPPQGIASPHPQIAGSGSRITLSFLPVPRSPVRVSWQAEIVEFKSNERFCDRQLTGPFTFWNHCHYLQPQPRSGNSGTLISDDLEYEWHDNILGELIHRLFLRRQIERTFVFRQARIAAILGAVTPSQSHA